MLCFWVLGASFSRFWYVVLRPSFSSASFLKLRCTKVFQGFLHTLEDGWARARYMSCTTYHKVIPFLYRNAGTFWSSCQRHWEKLNLSKARKSHLPEVEIPSPILSSPPTTASTETASGENSAGCPSAPSRKQPEPGPVQPHWLSAKRAMQSHTADALFAPLATHRTSGLLGSDLDPLCLCFVLFFCWVYAEHLSYISWTFQGTFMRTFYCDCSLFHFFSIVPVFSFKKRRKGVTLHLLLFITRKYAFICVKRWPTGRRYIHEREKANICA